MNERERLTQENEQGCDGRVCITSPSSCTLCLISSCCSVPVLLCVQRLVPCSARSKIVLIDQLPKLINAVFIASGGGFFRIVYTLFIYPARLTALIVGLEKANRSFSLVVFQAFVLKALG